MIRGPGERKSNYTVLSRDAVWISKVIYTLHLYFVAISLFASYVMMTPRTRFILAISTDMGPFLYNHQT